jgi:hypothetical protein
MHSQKPATLLANEWCPYPYLELLDITAQPVHSILLYHLSIPTGASLVLDFDFSDEKSPIPTYLPSTTKNLGNISHITSINLHCRSGKPGTDLRLKGPNGGLYMFGNWVGAATSLPVVDRRVLRSLNHFDISATEIFTITQYPSPPPLKIENSPAYQTLFLMKTLHTLTLVDCLNLPFVFALNPNRIPSKAVACPELEELVLYIKSKDRFCINELLEMVKERASRGAELSTITIVCPREFVPAREVLKLRGHVSSVEYRLDDVVPDWDSIPNDVVDDTGYETDW